MIRTEIIRVNEAWVGMPGASVTSTFEGTYWPRRVFGPARFLRLLHAGEISYRSGVTSRTTGVISRTKGLYWFAEEDFFRLKHELKANLKRGMDYATYTDRMDSETAQGTQKKACHLFQVESQI